MLVYTVLGSILKSIWLTEKHIQREMNHQKSNVTIITNY